MNDSRANRLPPDLIERARKVRLLVLDVDGVLTDGGLFYGNGGGEFKRFDVKDGAGIHVARTYGVEVALLTGKRSEMVARRAADLGIQRVLQGAMDKKAGLEELLSDGRYSSENVAYVGDDLLDLPGFRGAAFTACPSDAHPMVLEKADYVCRAKGGHGAVREVIDLILGAQGSMEAVEKRYWEE